MPGFVGVCGRNLKDTVQAVENATRATIYSNQVIVEDTFRNEHLILKKSFFSFLKSEDTFAQKDKLYCWIDGEVYSGKNNEPSFAEQILQSYLGNSLDSFLSKANGVFVGIIYDSANGKLHFFTDRYAIRPFYFYCKNNYLILATELKCFTHFSQFNLDIRKDLINAFIKLEHFMASTTWFDGVEIAAPSTIYTFDINDDKLTRKRYWSWSFNKRSNVSFNEAAEELSSLIDRAIKRRNFGSYKVGVALSGGYDSRGILAAISDSKPDTYTFGTPNSSDVKIAKQIAKIAGVKHHHFDMHVDNWLSRRFTGVWKTDGMLNMYHMHYSHLMDEIPRIMDVNLSGFLGDGVVGGSYITKKGKVFINKRMDETIARFLFGDYYSMSDPADSFFDLDKVDPYQIYNRSRRMVGLGAEEANKTIYQRMPFMDTELMDFSYSLPDEYRVKGKVYHQALLSKYPVFFRGIPHATTGVPITEKPSLIHKATKLYNHGLYMVKYKLGIQTSYTNVFSWIKEPQTAKVIADMLDPKKAIYANYSNENFVKLYLEPHLKGKHNYMKQIMGALTVEVWLQQVLNGKLR